MHLYLHLYVYLYLYPSTAASDNQEHYRRHQHNYCIYHFAGRGGVSCFRELDTVADTTTLGGIGGSSVRWSGGPVTPQVGVAARPQKEGVQ